MNDNDCLLAQLPATVIPGLHAAYVFSPAPFDSERKAALAANPLEWLGLPLRIALQFDAAPNTNYTLWACWMRADSLPIAEIPVLSQWWQQIPSAQQQEPILTLARASGLAERPAMWSRRFSTLLDQGSTLSPPDGRLLLLAAATLPESDLLSATPQPRGLTDALQHFVATLEPRYMLPFPPGCLLFRSGRNKTEFLATPHLQCHPAFAMARPRGTKKPRPITLSPAYSLRCEIAGDLLWGASRPFAEPSPVTRFVSATARADKGLRLRFETLGSFRSSGQQLLETNVEQMIAEAEVPDNTTKFLLRAERQLQACMERDGLLQTALKRPYALLAAGQLNEGLTMAEAATFPEPNALGTNQERGQAPGQTTGYPATATPGRSGFVSLWDRFSRDRQIQVLLQPPSGAATRNVA